MNVLFIVVKDRSSVKTESIIELDFEVHPNLFKPFVLVSSIRVPGTTEKLC